MGSMNNLWEVAANFTPITNLHGGLPVPPIFNSVGTNDNDKHLGDQVYKTVHSTIMYTEDSL